MYGLKEAFCLPIKHHEHRGDNDSQFYYTNYTHGNAAELDEVNNTLGNKFTGK